MIRFRVPGLFSKPSVLRWLTEAREEDDERIPSSVVLRRYQHKTSNMQNCTLNVDVCPLEAEDLSSPHTHDGSDEMRFLQVRRPRDYEGYRHNFRRFKNGWDGEPFLLAAHERWVRGVLFVTHSVAERRTKDFTNFGLRAIDFVD